MPYTPGELFTESGWSRCFRQAKEEIEREKRNSGLIRSYLCKVGLHRDCGGYACGCDCHREVAL